MVKIPLIVDAKSCLQLEFRAQKQNKKIAPKEESLRKLFYAKLCVILARIFEVLFWLVPNLIFGSHEQWKYLQNPNHNTRIKQAKKFT